MKDCLRLRTLGREKNSPFLVVRGKVSYIYGWRDRTAR